MDFPFSKRLKETRIKQGLTQKQLATMADVAVSSYSSYEKGVKMPPVDTASRMATALEVSLDWLCGSLPTVSKPETYADIFQMLLDLHWAIQGELNVEVKEIPWDTDESLLEHERARFIDAAPYLGEGAVETVSHVIMETHNFHISTFVSAWLTMLERYRNGAIDKELYDLWIENRLKGAKSSPVPGAHNIPSFDPACDKQSD